MGNTNPIIICRKCKTRAPKSVAEVCHWDVEHNLCVRCKPSYVQSKMAELDLAILKARADAFNKSKQIEPVADIDGKPLPQERQRDWEWAFQHGLKPSPIRFINGEPMAVYADGSGIYGPCPQYGEPID